MEEVAPAPTPAAAAPTPPVKPEGTTRRGSIIRHSTASISAVATAAATAATASQDASHAKAGVKTAGMLCHSAPHIRMRSRKDLAAQALIHGNDSVSE